jgi:DNA-binding beta-propeller fold protein YncE
MRPRRCFRHQSQIGRFRFGLVRPVPVGNGSAATSRILDPGNRNPGTAVFAEESSVPGDRRHVTNLKSRNVTPITIATNTVGKPIPVGRRPTEIAITPDGKTAYVSDSWQRGVTPITIATNTAGKPIKLGHFPGLIAITPAG